MDDIWEQDERDQPATELSEQECWELLRRARFGRLGYLLAGAVNIVPINAVVDGDRLVFRTAEGSKLLGIHMSDDVVFEVDETDAGEAVSVVARGRARVLSGAEEEQAGALPLRPMAPSWKGTFVQIQVSEVTGRRFQLGQA
jgi:nitroimidazol reductase NimA-like FMN-containing flavoprotein (pyridoxamine 5'-phosphate oxidase superfamily)